MFFPKAANLSILAVRPSETQCDRGRSWSGREGSRMSGCRAGPGTRTGTSKADNLNWDKQASHACQVSNTFNTAVQNSAKVLHQRCKLRIKTCSTLSLLRPLGYIMYEIRNISVESADAVPNAASPSYHNSLADL